MHNHRAEVNQHPFTGLFALGAQHAAAGFFDFLADIVGQRPQLPVGIAADNDDLVEQRGHFLDVEHDDVAALDVFQGGNGDFGEFFRSH